MIKYKLSGELKIETVNERNYSDVINFSYPINCSGLLYNRDKLLEKKIELEKVIKEVIEKS